MESVNSVLGPVLNSTNNGKFWTLDNNNLTALTNPSVVLVGGGGGGSSSGGVDDEGEQENLELLWTLSTLYLLTVSIFLVTRRPGGRGLSKCPEFVKELIQVLAVNSTLLIVSPLLILFYSVILLWRAVLTIYFQWIVNDSIRLMDPTDVAWAFESHAQCNNFTSLYVLKGICNVKNIQERILTKLVQMRDANGNYVYERLACSAKIRYGFYCWQKCLDFNVTRHVRLIDGDKTEFSEKDIFDEISRTADTPMSSELPQWEILIAPKFHYNRQPQEETNNVSPQNNNYYALIFRVHHSIMDGVSAGHVLKFAMADTPITLSVDPLKPPRGYSPLVKYFMYLKAAVLGPARLLAAMTVGENNCFHKNAVSGPKTFDWSRPVNMSTLRAIKVKTKATTTAVLMASIGGAIRNLAVKKGLPVPGKIHAAPTVAMLPYPDTRPRNRFVLMHFPMDISPASPVERLDSAHQTALKLVSAPEPIFHFLVVKICGQLPAFIADFLMGVLHATIIFSNVPGPTGTAYLFGGHSLVDAVFWVPIKNWTGMGACTFSYDGRVRASFVGDKACLNDDMDVAQLVQGFEQEISALAKASGVPPDRVFWTSDRSS